MNRESNIQQKGKCGIEAKAWKGEEAGYVAKHLWIVKHYGKASMCENVNCKSIAPKRFEWANISKNYHRERSDYKMLCPSCHRKEDHGDFCRKGHKYSLTNTMLTRQGWRICKICNSLSQKKYQNKKKQNGTRN